MTKKLLYESENNGFIHPIQLVYIKNGFLIWYSGLKFKQFWVLVKKLEIWKIFFESQTSDFKYLNILFLQKNYDFPIFIIFGQNHVCSRMSFVR